MKIITKLLFITIVLFATGCSSADPTSKNNEVTIHGSGDLVSKEINVADFDRLEAGLHFNLTIRPGEVHQVIMTSDDNFIDFIQVDQDGTALNLGLKPGYAYNLYDVTLQVEVFLPDLTGIVLNGSSRAQLADAESAVNFQAVLTGSSALEGTLHAEAVNFDLAGNSYMNLAGSADNLGLESCGNSYADLGKFVVGDAVIDASCNSVTTVAVSGDLDINASQHAQVFYLGQPESVNGATFENAFVGQR